MANNTEKRITAKMILDSTGYNDKLKGLNAEMKKHQSEIKLAGEGIKAFGKDSEKLKSVQDALTKQLELHSKKVALYKQSIEKTTAKMQENIKERDKLKDSLDKANKKYDEAVKLYGKESDEAKKAKENVDKLKNEHDKASKAVESNAKQIQGYETNLNKASAEMTKAKGNLNKVTKELKEQDSKWISASKGLKEHSDRLKNVGEKANNAGNKILGMTAPLVAVSGIAVKVGMDFDSQMSRVKAISGATGEEFKQLGDAALDLGATTAFSAKEVAEAQENMASAGFKVNELLEATPGVLDLAASSGEDLATASKIAAGAIRGFGLEASKSGHVADVLAKSAADTNAGVASMGEAFKYVAPLARNVGWDIESVAAAVGTMADANIDGSTSGTTLRGVISRLAKPSKESAKAMASLGFNAFDTQGKMKPLSTITDELNTKMEGLTDEQKQQAITTIFGQEAMSGLMTLMQKGKPELDKLAEGFRKSDGCAKEMAETMQDNAKASVEQMMGSMETAGIKLTQAIAPTIIKVADKVGQLADKFAKLSPETQKSIVKMVALSVGLGGVLKVGGGAISTIGTIAGRFSKLTGILGTAKVATDAVGTASAVAGGASGVGALTGALGTIAPIALPAIGIIGGVGLAAYGIHKTLSQEVVPSVDLFADKMEVTADGMYQDTIKISEGTKQAVGAYIEMDKGVTEALNSLHLNSTKITAENANELIKQYETMGQTIKDGLDKKREQDLIDLDSFFASTKNLSESEMTIIRQNTENHYKQQKDKADIYTGQIKEIMERAASENRQLTTEEYKNIIDIKTRQKNDAVKVLSENEVEANIILERMKSYDGRITAEQASEHIKNVNKSRDEAVKSTNDEYNKRIASLTRLRDESGVISKEQYEVLAKEAENTKNKAIEEAESTRMGVIDKMRSMNKDLEDSVDTTSGKILTTWDKIKRWWNGWKPEKKNFDYSVQGQGRATVMENWTGTNYFKGGRTTLHERGEEIYDLPRGTRIYNSERSEQLVLQTAEQVATKVAEGMLNKFNGNNGVNVTQNIYTPSPSPSEVARQTKNNLRELSLQW